MKVAWLAAAALALAAVSAHREYVPYHPNGALIPNRGGGLGHLSPGGGGKRNPYGSAWEEAGKDAAAWSAKDWALCKAESDGDGQSNGFELGDVCCNWTVASGVAPATKTSISNPGDAKSTSSRPHVNCTAAAPAAPFTRLRGAA